jgi:hypothetical protein
MEGKFFKGLTIAIAFELVCAALAIIALKLF